MANAIQSNLQIQMIADQTISVLTSRLAPLAVFSRNFTVNPVAPRTKIIVPLATTAATSQINPTNYESGDTTLSGSECSVNEIVQSWQVSCSDQQNGFTLGQLDVINVKSFANKITDTVLAVISSSNFSTASCNLTVSASAFSTAQLKTMRSDIVNNCDTINFLGDGIVYSQFIGVNLQSYDLDKSGVTQGVYGFDNFGELNRLNQCATPCNAIVLSPDAIAVASGIPILPDYRGLVRSEIITVPGIDLPVVLENWTSAQTRTQWRCLRVCFGAALGNSNALRYYVSP